MKQPNLIEKLSETLSFEMIFIEGGSFKMGSEDEGAFSREQPEHKVRVPDFYIGKYPVTQELWEALMKNNPSGFQVYNRPVERVSWNNTQDFIRKLNEQTGKAYRLLTEAEWEYAARGGMKSQGYQYAGSNKLKDIGWYEKNSYRESKPVGLKYPNELGLYDMSGNVWEWCADWFSSNFYQKCINEKLVNNPVNIEKGSNRVIRGGSWSDTARDSRCSFRSRFDPTLRDFNLGFRLGLSLQSVLP